MRVRAGVSAEVFGHHNKKEDFVPKVIAKSEEAKNKLKKRLL
jgi:cAMP-dependent protein kinase regulator